MSFINPQTNQLNCKIVYYGPALAGKSTTLRSLHKHYGQKKGSKVTNLMRKHEQSVFFDFLPLSIGKVGNQEVRIHLYAIPGPILYDANQRFLLKGIDGIVFVADSRLARMEENLACLQDLEDTLRNQETFLEEVPMVMQYNKRDLADEIVPLEMLNEVLNPLTCPAFESVATRGTGVVQSLETLTKRVLKELHYPE